MIYCFIDANSVDNLSAREGVFHSLIFLIAHTYFAYNLKPIKAY